MYIDSAVPVWATCPCTKTKSEAASSMWAMNSGEMRMQFSTSEPESMQEKFRPLPAGTRNVTCSWLTCILSGRDVCRGGVSAASRGPTFLLQPGLGPAATKFSYGMSSFKSPIAIGPTVPISKTSRSPLGMISWLWKFFTVGVVASYTLLLLLH